MRALNALNYPSLVRRQKLFHHCWTAFAGWCVGVGLMWGWQHWQGIQTDHLQDTHSRLNAEWNARKMQNQDALVRQNQGRMQQAQTVHLQQIAEHQQAWVGLHEGLLQEAVSRGLVLARLQVETDKIEMQGSLKRLAEMAEVRQSVSAHLPQTLAMTRMTRMTVGPAQEWGFEWRASWPRAQPSRLTSPVAKPDLSSASPSAASP